MWRPGPPGLSEEQRAETWRRSKSGHGVREIGRALGFDHGSLRSLLIRRGGFAPPPRKRARTALTLAEREDISRGISRPAHHSGPSLNGSGELRLCNIVASKLALDCHRSRYPGG
jgi:hypothetical protein